MDVFRSLFLDDASYKHSGLSFADKAAYALDFVMHSLLVVGSELVRGRHRFRGGE